MKKSIQLGLKGVSKAKMVTTIYMCIYLYFIYFMCLNALSACTPLFQKRVSDPTVDGCEPPPCGCWILNLGVLEE